MDRLFMFRKLLQSVFAQRLSDKNPEPYYSLIKNLVDVKIRNITKQEANVQAVL